MGWNDHMPEHASTESVVDAVKDLIEEMRNAATALELSVTVFEKDATWNDGADLQEVLSQHLPILDKENALEYELAEWMENIEDAEVEEARHAENAREFADLKDEWAESRAHDEQKLAAIVSNLDNVDLDKVISINQSLFEPDDPRFPGR